MDLKTLEQRLEEKAHGNPKHLNLFGDDLDTVIETVKEWLEEKGQDAPEVFLGRNKTTGENILKKMVAIDELLSELGGKKNEGVSEAPLHRRIRHV